MPAAKTNPRFPALGEGAVEWALFLCAAASILTSVGIVAVVVVEAVRFFRVIPVFEFLGGTEWAPLFAQARYGVLPLVWGTFLVAGIACLVALPVGLVLAIYLSEFASASVRRWAGAAFDMLAGIPTVVYGYCALLLVTPLLREVLPGLGGFSALSAGLVVGLMILPTIVSLSGEALRSVPESLREAAYALGSDRFAMAFRVVAPAAASGIAASCVVALSRALGETMIVVIAAGQFPRLWAGPLEPVQTMTAYIVQISLGDAPAGSLQYLTIFAVGGMLLGMTLFLNLVGLRLQARSEERVG